MVSYDNFSILIFNPNLVIFAVAIVLYLLYSKKFGIKLPPGPRGLPILGYISCFLSEPHKRFFEMRKQYGDIIGFQCGRRYYVVLNEFTIAKETLTHINSTNRDAFLFSPPSFGFESRNGAEWIQQRRFSIQSLKNLTVGNNIFKEIYQNLIEEFIHDIELMDEKPFDVTKNIRHLVINVASSFLFGRSFNSMTEKDKLDCLINYADMLTEEVQIFPLDLIIPGYSLICEYFEISGYRRKYKESMFKKLFSEERKRLNSADDSENTENFLNLYEEKMKATQSQKKGNFFNEENFLGNTSVLFLGATDTTSNSVRWLLKFMAKHQDVQAKVQKELDEVVDANGFLNYEDRFKVPYTFSVILEAQRISTILPISSPRMAKDDFEIRGYTIPKGSIIIVNIWGLHRDPNYWIKSEEFRPERFMESENGVCQNKQGFSPFLMGKRNCPGGFFALKMIFIFFTKLMRNFEVKSPLGKLINFESDGDGTLVNCMKLEELIFEKRLN